MIFCFWVKLGYKGPSNAYFLSDNLALALEDRAIIEKKLYKDLVSDHVKQLQEALTPSYICSLFGLFP